MPLKLSIDNLDRLPDGGPLSYTMRGESHAEIGRDTHLDWSLPDPQRFISGKHCEIDRQGDEYLLVDVSTNGTFVNGSSARVQSPYRLKNGDRLQIGEYLITVSLTRDDGAPAMASMADSAPMTIDRPASYDALWDVDGDIAPPADPKEFRPKPKTSPVYSDFLFHAADVPRVAESAQFSAREPSSDPFAPPQEEAPRMPTPRRQKVDDYGWDAAPPAPAPASEPARAAEPSAPREPAPQFTPPAPVRAREFDAPTPAPAPFAAPAPSAASGDSDMLVAIARAAGLPDQFFRGRDGGEVAEMLGRTMRIVTEEMQQLLQARVQAKRMARSSEHTVIEARENNPLKFSPTPEDALRIMLGPATSSYLGVEKALEKGFGDLKRHQVQTYSAMQQAVTRMVADLDPSKIESSVPAHGGVAGLMKSRKGELWDAYVATWGAQNRDKTEDVIQRFMILFGKYYDSVGDRS